MAGIWARLSWPQVAALAVMVAGALGLLVLVPADKLEGLPWEWIASIVAILLGGAASATLPPLVRSDRSRPAPSPRDREGGFVELEVLVWVIAFALACVWSLSGCGGALHVHARAATVAVVALDGADRAFDGALEATLAACSEPACVDTTEAEARPVAGLLDATAAVLSTYVAAVELALHAGQDDADILGAVGVAALRLAAAWAELAAALHPLGVDLPTLPVPGGAS